MIYFHDGKAWLMLGAERIESVQQFNKEYTESKRQEILDYTYFAYHKKSPFALKLPLERKALALEKTNFSYDQQRQPDYYKEVEGWPYVGAVIKTFCDLHYSHLERQRETYLRKVEKYNNILADDDSTFDQEQEADKALKIFTKQIEDIDAKIAKQDGAEVKDVNEHLLEVPEFHLECLKEVGYVIEN